MAQIFIHFIIPIILVKLFYKRASNSLLFLAGLFGVFPDLDYIYIWVMKFFGYYYTTHRTLFHNIFFVIVLLILFFILYLIKNSLSKYFLIFSFSVIIHLFLDSISGNVMLFWPINKTAYSLGMYQFLGSYFWMYADAVAFVLWITYLFNKKKILKLI